MQADGERGLYIMLMPFVIVEKKSVKGIVVRPAAKEDFYVTIAESAISGCVGDMVNIESHDVRKMDRKDFLDAPVY
jgi:hypothetical protein